VRDLASELTWIDDTIGVFRCHVGGYPTISCIPNVSLRGGLVPHECLEAMGAAACWLGSQASRGIAATLLPTAYP
jgi:hypothetical protein